MGILHGCMQKFYVKAHAYKWRIPACDFISPPLGLLAAILDGNGYNRNHGNGFSMLAPHKPRSRMAITTRNKQLAFNFQKIHIPF